MQLLSNLVRSASRPATFFVLTVFLFASCVKNIGDTDFQVVSTTSDNQSGGGDPTQPTFTTFKKLATKQLSNYRAGVAAAGTGNKVLFAGGLHYDEVTNVYTYFSTVDIFDAATFERTTANLSQARARHAAAAAGNKIVIAGGRTVSGVVSSRVDIYDVVTNTWTTAELSQARYYLTAAAAGNKIIFAGGLNSLGQNTQRVDIYNVSTNSWTSGNWGTLKSLPVAAGANNKIAVAGELVNSRQNHAVDIYNVTAGTWSFAAPLSVSRTPDAAAGAGKKILFAAGQSIKRVDIYNTETGAWTTKDLSENKDAIGSGSLDKYVVFAGGRCFACPGEFSNKMDIYNTETGSWSSMLLPQRQGGLAMATASNKLFMSGGSDYDNYYTNVDIYAVNYNPNVCLPCLP